MSLYDAARFMSFDNTCRILDEKGLTYRIFGGHNPSIEIAGRRYVHDGPTGWKLGPYSVRMNEVIDLEEKARMMLD